MQQHHIVAYLISLAVGYWVLTLSHKESKATKTVGQFIGWGIIIVSLCGAICLGACKLMSCTASYGACQSTYACPFSGGSKMGACPETKGMDSMSTKKDETTGPAAKAEKKPAAK